jgi:isopentenyl phosphate kinase
MRAKVLQSLGWIRTAPKLEVVIFSGMERGNLLKALNSDRVGTRLHASDAKPSDRI